MMARPCPWRADYNLAAAHIPTGVLVAGWLIVAIVVGSLLVALWANRRANDCDHQAGVPCPVCRAARQRERRGQ